MRLDPGLERAIELRVKLAEGEIDVATFCAAVRETGRTDPLAELIEGECLLSGGTRPRQRSASGGRRSWRRGVL